MARSSPAALAAIALTLMAGSARAETLFVGDAFVTSASPGCGSSPPVGEYGRLTYRPAYPGFGNGIDSSLAYIGNRSSFGMMVANGTFRSKAAFAGQFVSASVALATTTGRMLEWKQDPKAPDADEKQIALTMRIENFYAAQNCVVELQANLARGSFPGE